jgi:gluconolactonase
MDRIEKDGKRVVLTERYEGKRLSGPNDVVVKKDGAIYFADTFQGMRNPASDPSRELDYDVIHGIKNGKVTLVMKDIPTTNGLAFLPDKKYLHANAGRGNYIRRYDVQPRRYGDE